MVRRDWFAMGESFPNIRNLTESLLYPGVALLEGSVNYSVGRGTEAPFELVGAEFVHGTELAGYLNQRSIPGLRAYAVRFRPAESHLAGKTIEGVRFIVTNRDVFDAGRFGIELAAALEHLYPGKIAFAVDRKLIGSNSLVEGLTRKVAGGVPAPDLIKGEKDNLLKFRILRDKYLLYR